jgi:hypothetical protein
MISLVCAPICDAFATRGIAMFWFYGFCVLCWLVGAGLVNWAKAAGTTAPDDARAPSASDGGLQVLKYLMTERPLTGALLIALSPLWLPIAAIWIAFRFADCLRSARSFLEIREQYRELQFESARFSELDGWIQDQFEAVSGDFLALGFHPLGDFQSKFEPLPVYNRYFADPDRVVFGDLTALVETCSPGFISVLEDGTYVETSGTEPLECESELCEEDMICLMAAGKRPVAELLEIHRDAVNREASRRGTRVLTFHPNQFREVFVFGQRRFWTWRGRCGDRTGPIPEAVVPIGQPIEPDVSHADQQCVAADR